MSDFAERIRRQELLDKVFGRITPLPPKMVFECIPRADENYWRDRFKSETVPEDVAPFQESPAVN